MKLISNPLSLVVCLQMSGQKYKRTNFDDDDNTSTGGTPPGVTYDPAIAFKVPLH